MTEELPHVRCITCNKIIADKWHQYQEDLANGKTAKQALDNSGLSRICCRTRLMNPFKVLSHSERQIDFREPTYEKLSVASSDEAPAKNSLSAMKNVTNLTVVPEERSTIELPPLPSIPLPGTIEDKDVSKIISKYKSW